MKAIKYRYEHLPRCRPRLRFTDTEKAVGVYYNDHIVGMGRMVKSHTGKQYRALFPSNEWLNYAINIQKLEGKFLAHASVQGDNLFIRAVTYDRSTSIPKRIILEMRENEECGIYIDNVMDDYTDTIKSQGFIGIGD